MADDVSVYMALAEAARERPIVSMGIREIARQARIMYGQAWESLQRLERCGHVVITHGVRGQRSLYRLTSDVFGQNIAANQKVVVKTRSGGKIQVSGHRKAAEA